jgi:hypothetical protein
MQQLEVLESDEAGYQPETHQELTSNVDLNVQQFMEQLHSLNISPFASWDMVHSTLSDYHLDTKICRLLFDQYCQVKGDELRKARESAFKGDERTQFLKLVLNHRNLFWEEFKRRFRKEESYFNFGNNDRDREKLFREGKKMKLEALKDLVEGKVSQANSHESESKSSITSKQKAALEARQESVRQELQHANRLAAREKGRMAQLDACSKLRTLLVNFVRLGDQSNDILRGLAREASYISGIRAYLSENEIVEVIQEHLQDLEQRSVKAFHDFLTKVVQGKPMPLLFDDFLNLIMSENAKLGLPIEKCREVFLLIAEERRQAAFDSLNDALKLAESTLNRLLADAPDDYEGVIMKDVDRFMRHDHRWTMLDNLPEERKLITLKYLRHLEARHPEDMSKANDPMRKSSTSQEDRDAYDLE